MIGATGLLLGIALAMYRRVDADKRQNYRSMFVSTVLAVFLTGVTEPLEFMFMFCALPLYVVYAVLQGCAFAMAGVIHLRLHSFGNLEFITRIPMSLKAGLGGDLINFVICVVVFFIIGYVVAYAMIGKFRFATPGRLGNYTDETAPEDGAQTTDHSAAGRNGNSQAERIIALLGGRENIVLVDACMTRLRVTVKDISKVAELPEKLLADRWSIKPEDVESPERVEELYQKLGKQLKGLSNLLEENGQRGSSAYQNVTNLSQNVDFLQQINQTYAYIQLPLHLRQGEHKTGELFVYTNKKNLAKKDGQVSALLHLDMEHLGPLDVYVALKDTKVSTKFYVQNDAILDYLEANMDVLTERLQKRGYDCKCETTLHTELQQTAQAMAPLLKTEGSVPVAQYAFDVRT